MVVVGAGPAFESLPLRRPGSGHLRQAFKQRDLTPDEIVETVARLISSTIRSRQGTARQTRTPRGH